ncbi:MAG TPA: hypothetical protein VF120_00085 [Ktedonobacterales bacterium]
MATIAEELSSLVAQLPQREQERVLSFARELAHPPIFPHTPLPPGSPPDALLRIRLDPEVGEAMEQALADCERIDPDE